MEMSPRSSVFQQCTSVVFSYDWWNNLLLCLYHTVEVIREREPCSETIRRIWDPRNALCENLCSYCGTFQLPTPASCHPITLRKAFSEQNSLFSVSQLHILKISKWNLFSQHFKCWSNHKLQKWCYVILKNTFKNIVG